MGVLGGVVVKSVVPVLTHAKGRCARDERCIFGSRGSKQL
jgi:hypothetical protein